jgi:hypothetical protein
MMEQSSQVAEPYEARDTHMRWVALRAMVAGKLPPLCPLTAIKRWPLVGIWRLGEGKERTKQRTGD